MRDHARGAGSVWISVGTGRVWVVHVEGQDNLVTPRAEDDAIMTTRPAVPRPAETRYRTRVAHADRLVDGGLWLAVPAVVALVVGVCVPLLGEMTRLGVSGGGLLALLAAGRLVLRGRSEAGRARWADTARWRVHAVRVNPPLETRRRGTVGERDHAATG